MKPFNKSILSGILLLAAVMAKELPLGSQIPLADIKMQDVSGKELSLNDIKSSEGLLVIFSCNTCPWVTAWEDRYIAIGSEYPAKGIGMVAINPNAAYRNRGDGFKDMRKRAKEMGYQFYYTLDTDSRLALAFGATRTPHVFLFNKEGTLVFRGAIDDNARNAKDVKNPYLKKALDAMLTDKPIPEASTKALGCTIKFADKPAKI